MRDNEKTTGMLTVHRVKHMKNLSAFSWENRPVVIVGIHNVHAYIIHTYYTYIHMYIYIELGPYKSILNIEVSSFQGCFNT